MKRLFATLMAILMIAMAASGCAVPGQQTDPTTEETPAPTTVPTEAPATPDAPETPATASLKVALQTEPISMDPHVGNDSNTSTALMLAFEGLLNVVNGEIAPGMAESYEVSPDGTEYTFHLRDAKWSDGKEVTASDFAETYKRMLTRQDAMDLAYLIFPIKNAQPINAGEMDVSELGVEVIDEKTLKITLEAAYPFMVTLFASSPMYPIRNDLADELGNAYGSDAGKFECNGPFILKEWAHSDRMVFVKNPDYWNADAITLEEVTLLLVSDANTIKNMYDTGEIYFMQLTSDMIAAYEGSPDFQYFVSGGVTFIALSHNGTSEETARIIQNRNFVNALSAAIDRQALVDAMFPTNSPFTGVINPAISDELGGKWEDHLEYDVTDVYHKVNADPEAAKQYIQAACEELGYASPEDMPVFDFFTTSGEEQRTLCEYFQNIW